MRVCFLTTLENVALCYDREGTLRQLIRAAVAINHRITEGRDLLRWSCPCPPLLTQGQLEPVVQDHVQIFSEYLQGWRLHHLFGQPTWAVYHLLLKSLRKPGYQNKDINLVISRCLQTYTSCRLIMLNEVCKLQNSWRLKVRATACNNLDGLSALKLYNATKQGAVTPKLALSKPPARTASPCCFPRARERMHVYATVCPDSTIPSCPQRGWLGYHWNNTLKHHCSNKHASDFPGSFTGKTNLAISNGVKQLRGWHMKIKPNLTMIDSTVY